MGGDIGVEVGAKGEFVEGDIGSNDQALLGIGDKTIVGPIDRSVVEKVGRDVG